VTVGESGLKEPPVGSATAFARRVRYPGHGQGQIQ